jgi:hypothetical protein
MNMAKGMKKAEGGRRKDNGFWHFFLWLVVVVMLFTIIDSIIHATVEFLEVYSYPIPHVLEFISTSPLFWYAMGKFFGTVIIGSLLYSLVKHIRNYPVAILVFSVIITVLLEIRYIVSGDYSSTWHLANFLQHTIALYVVSYLVFKKTKSI